MTSPNKIYLCFTLLILTMATFSEATKAHQDDDANSKPYQDYTAGRYEIEIEQLAEGVYLAKRPNVMRFPVQSNSVIIINEDDVIVVDTGYPQYAKNLIREIKKLTEKPVRYVINTHWHQDHNHGMSVFREVYPDIDFIAHAQTRSDLVSNNENTFQQAQNPNVLHSLLAPQFNQIIQNSNDENSNPALLGRTKDIIAGLESYVEAIKIASEANQYHTITIDRSLTLYRGSRLIEIKYLGRANTAGDLVVWLPNEKILIAGDIVVAPTPYGFGSYPTEWIEVLKTIETYPFEILVPGHGSSQKNNAYVVQLKNLLKTIVDQTEDAIDGGIEDPAIIQETIDIEEYRQVFTKGNPVLTYYFDNAFLQPIIPAAIREIEVEDE